MPTVQTKTSQALRLRSVTPVLVALLVGVFFLCCTWPGPAIGFDGDDLMNLDFALQPPLGKLVVANIFPFTTLYRPAGSAYYRLCFALFGWNPPAFRTVTYGFLLANIFLVFLIARRLNFFDRSRAAEMGVLAAIFYSFHGRLRQIWLSNGTIYDVLCGTFLFLALWYYMRLRQIGRKWRWYDLAALAACFVGAVNAKEMAAILPALLLLYDWIYDAPVAWRVRPLARWMVGHIPLPAIFAAIAAVAFWGKRQPGSVFYGAPLYAVEFSLHRVLVNERMLISALFLQSAPEISTALVLLFYACLFGAAAWTRNKALWFGAGFFLLAPLPALFITNRGFFVMYIPLAGLAIFVGTALVLTRDWLLRVVWKRPPFPPGAWQPERLVLAIGVAVLVLFGRNADPNSSLTPTDPMLNVIRYAHDDLKRLNEPIPRGARILMLNSRFPDDSWAPLQEMRLIYHDKDLWVDRPTMSRFHALWPPGQYDRVIDFNGSNFVVVRRGPHAPGPMELPD